LLQSAHGFRFCEGSKFAISHWLGWSPLTQCWRYRAACDGRGHPQVWARGTLALQWKMYKATFASITTFWFAQNNQNRCHNARFTAQNIPILRLRPWLCPGPQWGELTRGRRLIGGLAEASFSTPLGRLFSSCLYSSDLVIKIKQTR